MVTADTPNIIGKGSPSGNSDSGILPMSLKILYSFGQMGVNLPGYFFVYLWTIYSPHGGTQLMPAYLLGAAYGVGVIIQAVANPFIGNMSEISGIIAR